MCNFAFCIDIIQDMNELDIKPQGADHLVIEMFDRITEFKLWEQQLRSGNI